MLLVDAFSLPPTCYGMGVGNAHIWCITQGNVSTLNGKLASFCWLVFRPGKQNNSGTTETFHFTPKMLCFIALFFLPYIHPLSFPTSVFRQANKNVTWRQNRGKSRSEYWQGTLAVSSVPGSSSSPAVRAGKAACGCGWRRQHSWGSDAPKETDAVFYTAHVSKHNSGSVGIVLWLCRCHQCIQQLHACLVGLSQCCSCAAGPSLEEAELHTKEQSAISVQHM